MEENYAEVSTERGEEELLPEELFFRTLGRNPESETSWLMLQPHLKNVQQVDKGKTINHSVNVDNLFTEFFLFSRGAEKVSDLTPEDQKLLYRGRLTARLHDLGKGTKENGEFKYGMFLNSNKRLDPDQVKTMYAHADDGAKILEELGLPPDIIETVRDHNKIEDGVLIDEITQGLVPMDLLEALTSKQRPYRGPAPREVAYDYVEREILARLADETVRRDLSGGQQNVVVRKGEGTVKEMFQKWKPFYVGTQMLADAA